MNFYCNLNSSHMMWSKCHSTCIDNAGPLCNNNHILPLTRSGDHLTVQHFSSEQERLFTTDMMILLLKCEAPAQMPHQRFKNNLSFLCKSFLKCLVSDLLSHSVRMVVLYNSEACKKTKRQFIFFPPCQKE